MLPTATPVIIPVADPAAAIDMLLLLHTPPGLASDNVVTAPAHTFEAPEMTSASGNGFTVIVFVVYVTPHMLLAV